jgi:hypothetical protein
MRRTRSEALLEKAQARQAEYCETSTASSLKRRDVETGSKRPIQTLRNSLEFIQAQDARDRDDKVLLHRPREPRHVESTPELRRRNRSLPRASGGSTGWVSASLT